MSCLKHRSFYCLILQPGNCTHGVHVRKHHNPGQVLYLLWSKPNRSQTRGHSETLSVRRQTPLMFLVIRDRGVSLRIGGPGWPQPQLRIQTFGPWSDSDVSDAEHTHIMCHYAFRRYADCFNVNGTLVPHHHAAAPHTDGKAGHNSHTSWHKKRWRSPHMELDSGWILSISHLQIPVRRLKQ